MNLFFVQYRARKYAYNGLVNVANGLSVACITLLAITAMIQSVGFLLVLGATLCLRSHVITSLERLTVVVRDRRQANILDRTMAEWMRHSIVDGGLETRWMQNGLGFEADEREPVRKWTSSQFEVFGCTLLRNTLPTELFQLPQEPLAAREVDGVREVDVEAPLA